ncbi:MFS general substrate transporter [Atractiella rhizophila]|nr:MFS general substrate transporter [Atractiella rhizophila]
MSYSEALASVLRDSAVGVSLHYLSNGRLFAHPEERPDFVVPAIYLPKPASDPLSRGSNATLAPIEEEDVKNRHAEQSEEDIKGRKLERTASNATLAADGSDVEKGKLDEKEPEGEKKAIDPNLVDWYDENDPENPQNWSFAKKTVTTAAIMLLTFSVYIGSAIYAPSIPGVSETFHVSTTKGTLGLSLFVLGYGVGPMILSPLSEIPAIGRNPVYIITLFLFVVLQVPAVTADKYSVLMAMRFLTGFAGSPALATGGASLADIWAPMKIPYAIALWSCGAILGPVLGPIVSGFAVQANGWKWSLYELLWISGFGLVVLSFILPETYAPTILLKRAQRLRKITGNEKLRSQSEIDQAKLSTTDILFDNLVRPFVLLLEPAVLFINIYIALLYSIFYLWFEAFPLVFTEIHGFNLGEAGLPFLSIAIGAALAFIGYICYQKYHIEPLVMRTGMFTPEQRLEIGLFGSLFPPVSLLLFGWLSRDDIHWIGPVIAAGLFVPGAFLIFQSCIVYLPMCFPKYAASLLAGNDLFRSSSGAAFPLFARAMYKRLTIGGGCSLLAGLSALMIPILYIFYKKGAEIRARSKYAG